MFKRERQPPNTVFEQRLNVSEADRQAAQEAFNYAKTLDKNGQGPAAEDQRQKARQILGLGLITGLAYGEESNVIHKKGKTTEGTEYVSVEATGSNSSKLPPQFLRDHRKAIAITAKGPLDSNPQLLKTASSLLADNAIKVVRFIGRGIGQVVSVTWDLPRKAIEAQKSANMLINLENKRVNQKMQELNNNSHEVPLPEYVKTEAKSISEKEHQRYTRRQEEIANSRVVSITTFKGGRQITEITHDEGTAPWK